MVKNLDVTSYSNGDPVPYVPDSAEWSTLKTGAWCYSNNLEESGKLYGRLYNWYAVNDPRGLAPSGWRIPTNDDWIELVGNLDGLLLAGGKLKAVSSLWLPPNKGATNSSGFTALPAGGRRGSGMFAGTGSYTAFWTATTDESREEYAMGWALETNTENAGNMGYFMGAAFSVRLIRE